MMKQCKSSKSGQAMIEFLLGLVGLTILLMGVNLIANIVYNDFTTIYAAREEVADRLIARSAATSGASGEYDFGTLDEQFEVALDSAALEGQLELFPSERDNQFDFLWGERNPMQDMVGSEKGSVSPVTSPFLQKILGRTSVSINNSVYMPPWEDLLYPEGNAP